MVSVVVWLCCQCVCAACSVQGSSRVHVHVSGWVRAGYAVSVVTESTDNDWTMAKCTIDKKECAPRWS